MQRLSPHLGLEKKLDLFFENCGNQEAFQQEALDRILDQACQLAGATVVRTSWHEFPIPDWQINGITIVKILAESHLVCHTYPLKEEGESITVSISTCGEKTTPQAIVPFLTNSFKPQKTFVSKTNWEVAS